MELIRYTQDMAREWDAFIAAARNGTFMLHRTYMDYHSDRFEDCSVVFVNKSRIVAAFPANIDRKGGRVCSHQGLTYGGLILSDEMTTTDTLAAMRMLCRYYADEYGVTRITYKTIPYIYHRQPCGDEDYALYRLGARLVARGVSTTVNLQDPIPYDRSRRNALKKAARNGLRVELSEDYEGYWPMLYDVLTRRHSVKPVHSAAELRLLAERHPGNIRLLLVRDADGVMIAGTYIYIYNNVVHTQYMTASDRARGTGALDLLVDYLIRTYSATHTYLDFGISTEGDGTYLNEGLIYQKEGFGGRGMCYDVYSVEISTKKE